MARSDRVLREALAYARIGWPVAPGERAKGRTARWRWLSGAPVPPVECGCGRLACPLPAAHPRLPVRPTREEREIRAVWGMPVPPNIVIATGHGCDVIETCNVVGSRVERLLTAWRVLPVVAVTASRRWLFFVAPGEAVALPAIATYHGGGSYVAAPPSSRGPAGEDRWVWPWENRHHALPPASDVTPAVWVAAQAVQDGAAPAFPRPRTARV